MTDKSSVLKAFNTHFFAFIDDIIRIFPDSQDIKNSKVAFELFKKANPTSILKAWYQFVYFPYRDVIESGYIEFFVDKDYNNDLTQMPNANEILKIIDTLREPIRQMSEVNKAHSLKYIQNLSKLSEMYTIIRI
jgi:hypothetical protein